MRIDPDQPDSLELRQALRTALAVGRWVHDVAARAPYPSQDALFEAARDAAILLTPDEIDEALSAHPRIGERALGSGAAATLSRREQSSADEGDEDLARRLEEGNRRYEERFGRIFVVRARGRSRAEVLGILEERLRNDDETETAAAARELVEIAMLRLRDMVSPEAPDAEEPSEPAVAGSAAQAGRSAITTHVLDIHRGRTAAGVRVTLEGLLRGAWHHLDEGVTNEDGRIEQIGPVAVGTGRYRLTFDTAEYFERWGQEHFFPVVVVAFEVVDPERHYHVPIVLSPFGYSTYRGS